MKNTDEAIRILPYSAVVGQHEAKLALEISFVNPFIEGVLLSGERGTAKSTLVRAFSRLIYENELPVTIPINATEDRVVGGYRIDKLIESQAEEQRGLLEEANGKILYIDEVNLLDDHIVNIILDVAAIGILHVQREVLNKRLDLAFTLVGTMNPEEGSLRPQLQDRFALMVDVKTEDKQRVNILKNSLAFDQALAALRDGKKTEFLQEMEIKDKARLETLKSARQRLNRCGYEQILDWVATVANEFNTQGNRAERILLQAARAAAVLRGATEASVDDVCSVAPMALRHRQKALPQSGTQAWGREHEKKLYGALGLKYVSDEH